jgi:hypothetical protein
MRTQESPSREIDRVLIEVSYIGRCSWDGRHTLSHIWRGQCKIDFEMKYGDKKLSISKSRICNIEFGISKLSYPTQK